MKNKKSLKYFLVVLFLKGIASAQPDTLKISSGSGSVGSSGNLIPINLTNSISVSGIQFAVGSGNGQLTIEDMETTHRTRGFTVVYQNDKVILYNINGESITSGQGAILNLHVKVSQEAEQEADTLSFIEGPILSNPQALPIEPVVTVAGIFTIEGTTGIELNRFTARVNGNSVDLEWGVNSNNPNIGFEVRRSRNGYVFSKIAHVQNANLHNGRYVYHYKDTNLDEGEYYYRLLEMKINQTIELGTIKTLVVMPHEYALEQNYPNPFNSATASNVGSAGTKIGFSIKQPGHVEIKVYNLLGKEAATIVNREYERGRYFIEYEARNLRSGVYIYKMEVNGFASAKKMLIIR